MQLVYYCLLIFGVSFLGGSLPGWMNLGHTRLQLAMSLIGGLMMGVALLHLLPHSVVASGSVDRSVMSVVVGLLAMFFLIRIFHVHPHVPGENADAACSHGVPHAHGHERLDPPLVTIGGYERRGDDPGDARVEPRVEINCPVIASRFGWCGLAAGLSLHTMIDGVALAASVAVERENGLWWPALGPFCAVLLHKPLDALSIATVMKASGWSRNSTRLVNACFSLMCPLGAFLFWTGLGRLGGGQQVVLGTALGFSAGVFLCIALSDLLPEVQFHSHDRWILSGALVAGVILAYLITFLEPSHLHHGQTEHGQTEHGQTEHGGTEHRSTELHTHPGDSHGAD